MGRPATLGGHQSAARLLSGTHAVWALLSCPREEASPAQGSRLPGRWVAGRTGCSVAARVDFLTTRAGHHQQKHRRVDDLALVVHVLDRSDDLALVAPGDRVAVVPLVVLTEVEDLVGPRARVRSRSRVGPGVRAWAGAWVRVRVRARSGLGFGSTLGLGLYSLNPSLSCAPSRRA